MVYLLSGHWEYDFTDSHFWDRPLNCSIFKVCFQSLLLIEFYFIFEMFSNFFSLSKQAVTTNPYQIFWSHSRWWPIFNLLSILVFFEPSLSAHSRYHLWKLQQNNTVKFLFHNTSYCFSKDKNMMGLRSQCPFLWVEIGLWDDGFLTSYKNVSITGT